MVVRKHNYFNVNGFNFKRRTNMKWSDGLVLHGALTFLCHSNWQHTLQHWASQMIAPIHLKSATDCINHIICSTGIDIYDCTKKNIICTVSNCDRANNTIFCRRSNCDSINHIIICRSNWDGINHIIICRSNCDGINHVIICSKSNCESTNNIITSSRSNCD